MLQDAQACFDREWLAACHDTALTTHNWTKRVSVGSRHWHNSYDKSYRYETNNYSLGLSDTHERVLRWRRKEGISMHSYADLLKEST